MHFSTFLAAGAATLAAAAPVIDPDFSLRCLDKPNLDCNAPSTDLTPGAFNITNFIFGCTATCNWYFNVTIVGSYPNHPSVRAPYGVYLQGDLKENTDYVTGKVSEMQDIAAYIETNDTITTLKLRYRAQSRVTGATYWYYGEQRVYSATSVDSQLQQPNFLVNETRFEAVSGPLVRNKID